MNAPSSANDEADVIYGRPQKVPIDYEGQRCAPFARVVCYLRHPARKCATIMLDRGAHAGSSYAWPYKSGPVGVFLTIFAVVAHDLNRDDLSTSFMVGYVTALAVVEVLRTRRSYEWTWLKLLNAAGALVLVSLATTGMFRLYGLVIG
jgi:hypothetical protein